MEVLPDAGQGVAKTSGRKARDVFPDLDIAKLLMAIVVVEIHTDPLIGIVPENVLLGFECFAVPFFFMASGFLCFKSVDMFAFGDAASRSCRRVRATTMKLLQLYLVWTVIYIPCSVVNAVNSGSSLFGGIADWVRRVVFVGSNNLSNQLWYLLAAVVAFALIYLLLRGGASWKLVLGLSAVFLLAGYLLGRAQYVEGLPGPVEWCIALYFKLFWKVRNGLFEGFFYVALGMAVAVRWERLKGVRVSHLLALFAAALVGCCLISDDAHLPFCALAAFCFFMLSVHRYGPGLATHPLARNLSTGIYLAHMLFAVVLVYGVFGGSDPTLVENGVNGLLLFLFALCGSAALSALAFVAAKRWPVVGRVFGYS